MIPIRLGKEAYKKGGIRCRPFFMDPEIRF